MTNHATPSDRRHWLFRHSTIQAAFWGLVALCVVLGLADFLYDRHGEFAFEEIPLAYAVYGFVSFVFIVFAGIGLRKLIMRDEDYYER